MTARSCTQPDPEIAGGSIRMCTTPNFKTVGLNELRLLDWSVAELLERIKELDLKLFSATNQPVGTLDQWLPIFSRNPQTWRAIVSSDGELAAYWQTAIVRDELYFELKAGNHSEGALEASSYVDLSQGAEYNLYFVSICVSPAYRGIETNMALIDSFFSVIHNLAEIKIFFNEVTCSVCSVDGEQIAKTFRLRHLRDNCIGRVYSGEMQLLLDRFRGPLEMRFPGLVNNYNTRKRHFEKVTAASR